jgi:hypothetical protein
LEKTFHHRKKAPVFHRLTGAEKGRVLDSLASTSALLKGVFHEDKTEEKALS